MQFAELALLLSSVSAGVINNISDSAEVVINAAAEVNHAGIMDQTLTFKVKEEAEIGEYDLTWSNVGFPMGSGRLINGGGGVLSSPKVYAIFYGNNYWTASNSAIFEDFMKNVGASNYFGNTRSELGAGYITWGAKILVNGGTSTTDLNSLDKVKSVVAGKIPSLSNPPNRQGLYTLILDSAKSNNLYSTNGDRYNSKFCGYHYTLTLSGVTVTFSANGMGGSLCSYPDWAPYYPVNDRVRDFAISVIGHELSESISDPWLNAWRDSAGLENMDKCANFPGAANIVSGTSGPIYNAVIGSRKYLLQSNYDQSTNTCPQVVW